jgi:hypothetical protein
MVKTVNGQFQTSTQMRKSILISCLIFSNFIAIQAQDNLYDFMKLGDFDVGFKDTIVFDENYQYNAYDYHGAKPNFIQIWHPSTRKNKDQRLMSFYDFFNSCKHDSLAVIQHQLEKNYREAVIRDCIEENLMSGEANNYGNFSYDSIFGLI